MGCKYKVRDPAGFVKSPDLSRLGKRRVIDYDIPGMIVVIFKISTGIEGADYSRAFRYIAMLKRPLLNSLIDYRRRVAIVCCQFRLKFLYKTFVIVKFSILDLFRGGVKLLSI